MISAFDEPVSVTIAFAGSASRISSINGRIARIGTAMTTRRASRTASDAESATSSRPPRFFASSEVFRERS